MTELPEHARRNRVEWDRWAAEYIAAGERHWASNVPTWGIWGLPEDQVRMFPDSLKGLDVVELGCGTAYVSSWLARRGARPVGVDNSEAQLATARRLQAEHGLDFPLIHGNAEATGLPDAAFDFAISEYGASIWCDPYVWLPEAARLLRPGGLVAFLVNTPLLMLCMADLEADQAGAELRRDYFGMHRFEWDDDNSVEFHLPHGEMIRLLDECGFTVEALNELRAPRDATSTYTWVSAEWAHRWPSEEVWVARKR